MEEKEQEAVPNETTTKRQSPNLWKLIALILVATILLASAYFLGTQKNNVAIAPTITPTSVITQASQNQSVSPTGLVSPTKAPSKSVEAGQVIGIFIPYRIQVPNTWTSNHESTNDVLDDLVIEKGSYKISIRQAGGEGSNCLYDNQPPQDFSQNYKTYVEFKSLDEVWRRSGDVSGTGWTLCHKTQSGWGFPSLYGYISYANPSNANPDILKEMDAILSTITKQ